MDSQTDALLVDGGSEAVKDDSSLPVRIRDAHNFIYANEGIKQYSRVTDEVVKLIFAKLSSDGGGSPLTFDSTDADLADQTKLAFASGLNADKSGALFEDGDAIKLSDKAIAYSMRKLGSGELEGQDPKGIAFQAILGPSLRGELGQFFTPDPVKSLLVRMTGPRPDEAIADPASGSGGLLLDAHRYQAESTLVASEIDASLARLARLNFVLSGVRSFEVHRVDALRPTSELSQRTNGSLEGSSIDVVVSNPPFGSKGKVNDPEILAELQEVSSGKTSMAPEILFIERIVQLLKPGGRAGIVLPSGVLSNPSLRHVRSFLRNSGRIYATVSLPVETFMATGNSVNSSILFFEKNSDNRSGYPTFRGICRSIGYDRRGRLSGHSDIPQILSAWDEFTEVFRGHFSWLN